MAAFEQLELFDGSEYERIDNVMTMTPSFLEVGKFYELDTIWNMEEHEKDTLTQWLDGLMDEWDYDKPMSECVMSFMVKELSIDVNFCPPDEEEVSTSDEDATIHMITATFAR